jgi:hypothetical protein
MSDYLLPFLFAFRPGQASRRIATGNVWWQPAVGALFLAVATAFVSHSLAVSITIAHLPPSAGPQDVARVRTWLAEALVPRLLFIPVRVVMECGVSGLLLLGFVRAFTGRPGGSFRGLFALSLCASAIPLFWRGFGMLWGMAVPSMSGHPSLTPVLSLADLVGPGLDFRARLLLTSLNLSTLWSVGAVAVGVTVLCGCRTGKAILAAFAVWTVSTTFSIVTLLLIRNAYAFLM